MFLVFGGDFYYPRGGWDDFLGDTQTLDDALRIVASRNLDWWHIVNGGKIVESKV